jgi:CDP-4-dehydro-6-deoxyglucose reductase, E3
MPTVEYAGVSCHLQENESVLDGLLRTGVSVPYSCKAGTCGSCLMRAANPAALPARSQNGLKDSWRANGYFLACVCTPDQDLQVTSVGDEARTTATIASIEPLSDSVLRVRLITETPFEYRAGQYLTMLRETSAGQTLARSYSLASLPAEGALELQVRILPNGQMSQWLATQATVGAEVQIQGPSGDCFYLASPDPARQSQPLILAGTGTGLAPLYGIARDALTQGHTGPIHLFHGAATDDGLYLHDALTALAAAHANFTYTPTVLATDGPIDQAVLARFPKATGHQAFLCGDPAIVQSLKKKLFLAGASLNDLHADAFLPSV